MASKNPLLSSVSAAQAIALSKITSAGIDTSALHHTNSGEQVEHSGSVAVIVDYSFKVAADEEYTPTISMPYKAVLGLLAAKSPEMAEAVIEAMNEALTLSAGKAAGDESATEALKAAVKAEPEATAKVDDMLASLPKSTRKGKVHGVKIDVQALEVAEVKDAMVSHAAAKAEQAIAEADEVKALFA